MSANNIDQQIRSRIDAFLAEVDQLVRDAAFVAIHEILGDGSARRRRGPGRPRGSGRRGQPRKSGPRTPRAITRAGRRVRRSAVDLDKIASRVIAYVRSHAGQRLEEIGKGLGTDTAVLKRPIANLLAARSLRTTGQKRGTKYFAGGRRGSASKAARKVRGRTRRKTKRGRRASRKSAARRAAKAATPVVQIPAAA